MTVPTTATPPLLRRITAEQLPAAGRGAVDPDALRQAAAIVADVRRRGLEAVREHAERLGDLRPGDPIFIEPPACRSALDSIESDARRILESAADRIRAFAQAQRACLTDLGVQIPGGCAGHTVTPVQRAGCYAPGGRFPLPSSVLMTAVTARAAGVSEVWVASPRPEPLILAAAAIAGAEGVLGVGGAQAIAALAYGAGPLPPCDAVVGPGNRWVTAAKQIVAGTVAIDMLAGPSEVLIIADDSADPQVVAADLLAQAEHDPDAVPMLITTSSNLADATEGALKDQLEDLPTRRIAAAALHNGFVIVVPDLDGAARVADRIAPEHLELMTRDDDALAARLRNYGALFIGPGSAEVIGDYGAGPNHVLPTGGTARSFGGLSVLTFLRVRTWLRTGPGASPPDYQGAAAFARLEGLEAHARAAERRLGRPTPPTPAMAR